MSKLLIISVATWVAAPFLASAEDWAQYRGNTGDGTSSEQITRPWAGSGPKRVWTANTPAGFSSIVVADGKAFTVVSRDSDGTLSEVCVALDAHTGRELWAAVTGKAKYRGGGDSGAEGNKG